MAMTAAPAFRLLPHDELVRALSRTPPNPWPTIDDRDAWERAAGTPPGRAIREAALADAEQHAETPGVRLPTLTEFLAFTRTGDRGTWEKAAGAPGARLDAFALAACFTGEARWIDKAADALWSLCEMTTWTTPAHHDCAAVPEPDHPVVELFSAGCAQHVAETLQTLGPALDRIDPRIRRRALGELDRRVFDPFLARGDWWWLWQQPGRSRLNNWTAVCSGCVLVAALAVLNDDPERLARVVHKAAWSLGFFKDTFEAAGSLDEGAGYWSYGVSHYAMAAERLAARTDGAMDLLADPLWREIARFPLRVRLYGDTFVNFSDCAEIVRPAPGWLAWLGRRLDVPDLVAWAERLAVSGDAGASAGRGYLPGALRTLFWTSGAEALTPVPSPNSGRGVPDTDTFPTWREAGDGGATGTPLPELGEGTGVRASAQSVFLPDVQWLIARGDASEDALVLAVKGGHNAENHNHNDGGSFLVHWRREALIAELGAPTYTRQFFSAARYENIAARSLGHSVPFVNGQEQRAGRAYAARVRAREDGALSLELAGLYPPEARLVSLRRDIALRGEGDAARVTLSDHAVFLEEGCTLSLPLITRDRAVEAAGPGRARIRGERGGLDIAWDPAQATCRAEDIPTDDPRFLDAASGRTRLRRLWLDVAVSGREARLDLVVTPRENFSEDT